MTNTRTAWTEAENTAVCRLYFTMLDAVRNRQAYSKAALVRAWQGIEPDAAKLTPADAPYAPLAARSRGSIEAKLMNASAAHRDYWLANGDDKALTMDGHGYRCLGNYQAALYDAMAAAIARREAAHVGRQGLSA